MLLRYGKNKTDGDAFTVYVIPSWQWKEFIAFELIGGAAFYLLGKLIVQAEWFCVAANIAGPQMLKYLTASFRV